MNYRKRNKMRRRSFRRARKKLCAIKPMFVARYRYPKNIKNKLHTFRVNGKGFPRKIHALMDDLPIGDFFYCERNPYWELVRHWESVPGLRKCGDGYEVGK